MLKSTSKIDLFVVIDDINNFIDLRKELNGLGLNTFYNARLVNLAIVDHLRGVLNIKLVDLVYNTPFSDHNYQTLKALMCYNKEA